MDSFSRIPGAVDLQLGESLGVVDYVLGDLGSTVTGVVEDVKAKLDTVHDKNTGLRVICEVNVILEGQVKLPAVIAANDAESFRYAPLTSCDVERSFLHAKTSSQTRDKTSFLCT